jgi:hypothetical protein
MIQNVYKDGLSYSTFEFISNGEMEKFKDQIYPFNCQLKMFITKRCKISNVVQLCVLLLN